MLFEQIKAEVISALKAHDSRRAEALKLLLAALQNQVIEKRTKQKLDHDEPLTEAEVLEVILREIKKRKESVESYEKGGRKDLADQEKFELEILSVYAPKQLSEEEIRQELSEIVKKLSPGFAFNDLMKAASPQFKNRAEMGLVSKIAKELVG